jgi:hypothetical protein
MQCESSLWFRSPLKDGRTHDPAFWTYRNVDCDYSSAYVILKTSSPDLKGVGMTFTIGRGNDIVRFGLIPLPDNPLTITPT